MSLKERECPVIEVPNVGPVKLGLVPPVLRGLKLSAHVPAFADAHPVWDVSQIKPVDRRKVFDPSWIKNQSNFGSCNGWAAATALSKTRFLRGQARVDLSGSSVYAQINGGRDQGSMLRDGLDAMTKTGVLPESESRVDQIYMNQYPQAAWADAARFKIDEAYTFTTEAELLTGLMNDFIAVVAVQVDNAFSNVGVDGVSRGRPGPGNHAVHLDGMKFSDKLGCWCYDLPNSWGTSWGDSGRIFVTFNQHLRACLQYTEVYLIRSVVDDAKGDNPPAA